MLQPGAESESYDFVTWIAVVAHHKRKFMRPIFGALMIRRAQL